MKLTQPWVGWIDRSYEQIKASVLRRLSINNPEISDHSESNVLVILISIWAGIAEGLHLYMDNMAREAFLGVARKLKSVIRLSRLIDYNIKASWYSSIDLAFTLTDSNGVPQTSTQNILIPKDTLIRSDNGITVRTLFDTYLQAKTSSVTSTAVQYENVVNEDLGDTNGDALQTVLLPNNYVHGSLLLFINNEYWTLVNSLATLGPNSKNFVVFIDEDKEAFAQFGDGVNGKIPQAGYPILGSYKTTQGSLGNLPPNSYNTILTPISLPDNTLQIRVTHAQYSAGGSDVEDIEKVRKYAPWSLRTLDRAVTYQDYKDVTNLQPGVGNSEVRYDCGKFVDVYIVPSSKGIATQALLASVKDALNCKKMITTQINVVASGLSRVWIKAKVYARPLFDTNATLRDVINALDADHGFDASGINRSVVISDIATTMELVPSVDRVQIEEVRIEPYIRAAGNNVPPLNYTFNGLPTPTSNAAIRYKIVYQGGQFQIYKTGTLVATIAVGATYQDNTLSLTLKSGSYANGNTWDFTAFPWYPKIFPEVLIKIDDNTMPIIDIGPLIDPTIPRTIFSDIQVIAQTIQTSCLPPSA